MQDNPIHLLQVCRRRSKLTQGDIGFITESSNTVSISRYEKGKRMPSVEILMTYHILFEVSLSYLLPDLHEALLRKIRTRCGLLKATLESEQNTPQQQERLAFLERTLVRLEALEPTKQNLSATNH